ncbi:R3H domain-containing nucleic acid-binding protein [cf. Phormidesmis sp. LEGE 11477]|uniref:Jag family protein n=1 Tax=cf. Phormidesmis sp. LEGE 11477 TaxID=1828680 RepID=UPI001880B057|nr:R3H domain-containing nucleic acid-binding protein [cf. Phormidesmis sp. LEGE 11477]MBE9060241.1 RNA-binding protein [cf. Phormidesmis sp. LEGE 11477]
MEKSISWLEKLLELQGLKTSVSGHQNTAELGDDSYWLTIDTESLSEAEIESLIGDRGRNLDSTQYLANTILNMDVGKAEQRSYTIEVNGYRKKRQAELKSLADEAADQVLNQGQSEYELKGLSAAERRQLHGLLGEQAGLETFSRGREPDRHLVVKLVDADSDHSDEEA